MKYFLDTEFIEWAGGIQLVSIGIISEDGRKFYAESSSFDERNADEWVMHNVLSKLEYWTYGPGEIPQNTVVVDNPKEDYRIYGTESYIKTAMIAWFLSDKNPQFYAYYASYDWVVLCRIFGRMIDLPSGWPMFVMDLKQMMEERGLDQEWKRKVCPDPAGEHNALADAEWNMKLYNEILNSENNGTI